MWWCRTCKVKRASYGDSKVGSKFKYCVKHKLTGMIDIRSKKCIHYGCSKQPSSNFRGLKTAIYCVEHRQEGMTDIISKRCMHDGCELRPGYNVLNSKIGIFCKLHRLDNMVDVVNKVCIIEGCNVRSRFNIRNSKSGLFCSLHRLDGMVDVTSKRCIHDNCDKFPIYNIPKSKIRLYCILHKLDGMINVTSKTCIGQEGTCTTFSGKNHRGYCLFCFVNTFPDEPIIRNYKTKECKVVEHVQSNFPDFTWRHDKRVDCGISNRRPDLFLDLGSHVLIVEVDEDSHSTYDCSCENKRLMQLSQDVDHRPLVMIRFNPDSYTDSAGTFHPSCWVRGGHGLVVLCKKRLPDWESRLAELVRAITFWAAQTPDKMIQVIELFISDS